MENVSNKTVHPMKYCPNALAHRLIITKSQSYIVAISIAVIILPSFIINGLLLLTLVKTKKDALVCKIYISVSAISGLLNSVVGFPLYVVIFTTYHDTRQCLLENISICVVQIYTHTLAYAILVLAVDRYFSVRPHFGWSKSAAAWMQSRKGSVVMCISILLLSILHGLVSVNFFTNFRNVVAKLIMIIFNAVIACGIYVAYLRLYVEINAHKNSFKGAIDPDNIPTRKVRRFIKGPKYLREFIKTVAILLVAGIVCYLPFIVMDCWTGWYSLIQKTVAPPAVRFAYYVTVIPVFLHSSVNALLFLYRNEEAKQYVKRRICSQASGSQQPRNDDCLSRRRGLLVNGSRNINPKEFDESSGNAAPKSTPLLDRAIFVVEFCSKPK